MTDSVDRSLSQCLEKLKIPPDIIRLVKLSGLPTSTEQWKNTVAPTLNEILVLVTAEDGVDSCWQADVAFSLLPFIPSHLWHDFQPSGSSISIDNWSTPESLRAAQGMVDMDDSNDEVGLFFFYRPCKIATYFKTVSGTGSGCFNEENTTDFQVESASASAL